MNEFHQRLFFFALTRWFRAIHRSVLIEASMTGKGDSFIVRPSSPFFELLGWPFRQLDPSLGQVRWISKYRTLKIFMQMRGAAAKDLILAE